MEFQVFNPTTGKMDLWVYLNGKFDHIVRNYSAIKI